MDEDQVQLQLDVLIDAFPLEELFEKLDLDPQAVLLDLWKKGMIDEDNFRH
jgi:hypothetical protein